VFEAMVARGYSRQKGLIGSLAADHDTGRRLVGRLACMAYDVAPWTARDRTAIANAAHELRPADARAHPQGTGHGLPAGRGEASWRTCSGRSATPVGGSKRSMAWGLRANGSSRWPRSSRTVTAVRKSTAPAAACRGEAPCRARDSCGQRSVDDHVLVVDREAALVGRGHPVDGIVPETASSDRASPRCGRSRGRCPRASPSRCCTGLAGCCRETAVEGGSHDWRG